MIEEIQLKRSKEIKGFLDEMCTSYDESKYRAKASDGSYYSYDIQPEVYPELRDILNEQGIIPLSYLVSVIHGHPGTQKFGAHKDKQRHMSIVYVYTDNISQTNFYKSKLESAENFFFNEEDLILEKSYYMEPKKFYIFDHQEIHDVKQINETRITVSINTKIKEM